MTLAAPPEKMTNAEDLALKFIEALGATVAHSVTLNRLEVLTIAREAARRLSAPAALPREPTPEMYAAGDDCFDAPDPDARSIWRAMWDAAPKIAPTPAAPRVGDDGLREKVADIIDDLASAEIGREAVLDAADAIIALSAPPAASADERETMAEEIFSGVHPRWMWKTWTDEGDPETYGRKQFRAMADAALGYRKRAAQGVGTDIEAGAARVHLRYLSAAKRLGWTIRPGLDVPYEQLSEAAKEIDRETYRAAIAGGDDE